MKDEHHGILKGVLPAMPLGRWMNLAVYLPFIKEDVEHGPIISVSLVSGLLCRRPAVGGPC